MIMFNEQISLLIRLFNSFYFLFLTILFILFYQAFLILICDSISGTRI